jgi:hypothetical protein
MWGKEGSRKRTIPFTYLTFEEKLGLLEIEYVKVPKSIIMKR